MDLTLHPTRLPATLEKWYIDALLDDGAVLLVYLGALTLFGVRFARVTAELFPASGPAIRGSAIAHQIQGGPDRLDFGPASLAVDHLRFTTDGLSGELIYQPRFQACALREPFLARGNRTLHWSVEVPDADVTGTLHWPGGMCRVAGRGYRDRVWFDFPPWRFPIHELVWGRAAAGAHAATWVRAMTAEGAVAASWLDGHVVGTDESSGSPPGVVLEQERVFLDADVASLEGLHLGAIRGLMRRLSGDPHETKWQASCTIEGTKGMAVHEVVRWRTKSY